MKIPVIREEYHIKPAQKFMLNHNNLVKGSFVSNLPAVVNYQGGTVIVQSNDIDSNGDVHLIVSYSYEDVVPAPIV